MDNSSNDGVVAQLRRVVKDGIDYFNSVLKLQQVRLTSLTLSGFLFLLQIAFAALLGLVAFVLVNIALGIWLTRLLGNPLLSLSILSVVYILVAWLAAHRAFRWLKTLKS